MCSRVLALRVQVPLTACVPPCLAVHIAAVCGLKSLWDRRDCPDVRMLIPGSNACLVWATRWLYIVSFLHWVVFNVFLVCIIIFDCWTQNTLWASGRHYFSRGVCPAGSLFLNALISLHVGSMLPWQHVSLTTFTWDSWTVFVSLAGPVLARSETRQTGENSS